jgi:hypothetical protein
MRGADGGQPFSTLTNRESVAAVPHRSPTSLAMKYALIVLGLIVILLGLSALRSWFDEGVSGDSTFIGDSFVMGEYGYGRGGRLTYAVIRSFPKGFTDKQRNNDPRYRETESGVLIRNEDGQMIPVGREGIVYFFDGDRLRTIRVDALESDIGIGVTNRSLEDVWANLQRFEIHTKK